MKASREPSGEQMKINHRINTLLLIALVFPSGSCIFQPLVQQKMSSGPYIDSIGYQALQARLDMVDREADGALVSEALAVQNDTPEEVTQTPFFQSVEESYQRYLKLFTPVKRAARPEVRCDFNLVETFKLLIIDPQPFINALLHTMSLTKVTTLDFRVEPKNTDTTLLYVSLTSFASQEGTKRVTIAEGDCILSVTGNRAFLMTPIQDISND